MRVKPSRLHRLFDIYIDDIISGCSSNFSRKSHQQELFETSYGTFVLANLFNHPISITFNQFLTLISSFLRKVHLFGDQMATHSLMLSYLPQMFYSRFYFLVTLNCVVRAVHACSCQVFTSWLIWLASSTRLQRFEIVRHRRTNYSIVIVRPDLLLATKSVVIALDSVDKSSAIISIEFTIYLRSMSSPLGSRQF